MADDGSDYNPLDLGMLGYLGLQGARAGAAGFRAIAPYLGRAAGSAMGALSGPVGAGAMAAYETMRPTTANSDEVDMYVRDPSGALLPNPKAMQLGLLPHAGYDESGFENYDFGADDSKPSKEDSAPAPKTADAAPSSGYDEAGFENYDFGPSPVDVSARSKPPSSSGPGRASSVATTPGQYATAPSSVGGFFGRIGNVLHNNSNMFLGLGAGLAGKRSFGEAMSGGFEGAAKGGQMDVSQNMQMQGIRAAYSNLIQQGIDPRAALAAVYNPELMKALINRQYGVGKVVDGEADPMTGVTRKVVQYPNGQIVPLDAASKPVPVRTFEEALKLPKHTLFSLPDGRGGMTR
jgi:hypothetical protein